MGRKELLIGKEKDVRRVNETKGRREGKELRIGKGTTGKNRRKGEDGIASAAVSGSDWS